MSACLKLSIRVPGGKENAILFYGYRVENYLFELLQKFIQIFFRLGNAAETSERTMDVIVSTLKWEYHFNLNCMTPIVL